MLTQGVNDGLATWARWGWGGWGGGVMGRHCWEVSLSWKLRHRERSWIPRMNLKDGIFQKEALVIFQVVYCYFFNWLGKDCQLQPHFLQFTRHDRLYLQCNKMLNSTDTFTKMFAARHSLCYLSEMNRNRQSSLTGPAVWTEHLESSSCHSHSFFVVVVCFFFLF